ncbi:aldehyde dehydrogenase (NAD+) [Candidatus Kryptonium thompsonii]|mgnify:CR=1 FL=1|uniref:Aldehyde dehydrogenase (NAD+) n=1 Tax=Candidatus Kryptonium thompsonii TaxID=1633631 RepID=A0A0P1M3Q6_9BACT|nr:aldehyde dehydrogenase family protein [Candidatus Kryptonium thompsoni]CUS76810.1 aldehyde dehydrogenase (NAD+) [Candidatus Kryptonium thompsoni]CUS81342.1 aldehyde dehydrogenase (NAD+) [Candidatus Kryptonium thompsoni]CUS87355.1 aldehyde dehydrogenase (NAD+) [Candidatus Kryptonium thompsoni]CUS89114.1 aldehyde dehydrogenase (NAD+) [Candidatus Kryptonium thompsoni]CUS89401.1 aldehyde dehydrogenase (NAD+) [Candidatus Kryptonium thompsoni]
MAEVFKNYINGKWVDAKSGKTFENRNPANWDDLIGVFPKSGPEDVEEAVKAAKKAFESWRLVPPPKRADIVKKAADLLVQRKEEIAREMTREMGKILLETRGDVQEGIDTGYYAAGEGRRLFSYTTTSELPNKFAMAIRLPVGVAGVITPWNFPMAIPTWKIFPALVAGNTVVFKPASDTPKTATTLVQILEEAGVPEGVVNLVHGGGNEVGMAIVKHPDVNLISFTGSTAVGKVISREASDTLKRVSLEMGGKNAQIVLEDANLELALDGVLWGAFGTSGQRCTATSRLILHEAIYDQFIEMLVERVKKLKVGNGLDESTEMGPIINEAQLNKIHQYVEIGKQEGAKLLIGGHRLTGGEYDKGWFYAPTIFVDVHPKMRIAQEEIFGPVLCVIKVKSFEEAIEVLNDSSYGLSSSVYTRDVNKAFKAIRDIQAGITYINAPTIGAETHLPFGGVKQTGNGHREGGWTVFDFFTEIKTVYIDYSDRLQRAQIDTYKE